MARYEHIKIYKSSFDLLVQVQKLTTQFPRDFRYTIGEKINNGIVEFLVNIYQANSGKLQQRLEILNEMSQKLQTIIILTRLAFELKYVAKTNFLEVLKMAQEIERQLAGWINYTEKEVSFGSAEQLVLNEV